MALITCPECGKECSERAKACPNCGYPILAADTGKAKKNGWLIVAVVIILIAAAAAAAVFFIRRQNDIINASAEETAEAITEESRAAYLEKLMLGFEWGISDNQRLQRLECIESETDSNGIYHTDEFDLFRFSWGKTASNGGFANFVYFLGDGYSSDYDKIKQLYININDTITSHLGETEYTGQDFSKTVGGNGIYTTYKDILYSVWHVEDTEIMLSFYYKSGTGYTVKLTLQNPSLLGNDFKSNGY